MGRARGKHPHRRPTVAKPGTPEGDAIGLSDRQEGQASPRLQGEGSPIPGGRAHIGNHESIPQEAPIPEPRAEHRGILAHGVPPDSHTGHERAEAMRGPNDTATVRPHRVDRPVRQRPVPVPVYIVEDNSGPAMYRSAAPRHFTLNASTGEPVRLCGRDPNRVRVMLLNESSSSNIRFGQRASDLTGGGGALLPWPNNSYVVLETQDELWAVSADSGTPIISIIQEFDRTW